MNDNQIAKALRKNTDLCGAEYLMSDKELIRMYDGTLTIHLIRLNLAVKELKESLLRTFRK